MTQAKSWAIVVLVAITAAASALTAWQITDMRNEATTAAKNLQYQMATPDTQQNYDDCVQSKYFDEAWCREHWLEE